MLSLPVYRHDAMAAKINTNAHSSNHIHISSHDFSEALFKANLSLTLHDRPAVESLLATGLIFF